MARTTSSLGRGGAPDADRNDLVALRLAHTELHARLETERAVHARAAAEAAHALRQAENDRDQARARASALAADLDRRDGQLRTSTEALGALRGEVQRWKAAHLAAKRHTEQLEGAGADLRRDLDRALRDVVPSLKETNRELQAAMKAAEAGADEQRALVCTLKEQLATVTGARNAAARQARDLQQRCDLLGNEVAKRKAEDALKEALVQAEKTHLDADVRALRDRVAQLSRRADQGDADAKALAQAQVTIGELRETLQADRNRIVELRAQVDEARRAAAAVGDQAGELRVAGDDVRRDRDRLAAALADADRRLHEAQSALAAQTSANDALQRRARDGEVGASTAQARLAAVQAALDRAEARVSALEASRARAESDASSTVQALQAEAGAEQRRADAADRTAASARAEVAALNEKLAGMRDLVYDLLSVPAPRKAAATGTRKKTTTTTTTKKKKTTAGSPDVPVSEVLDVLDRDIRRLRKDLRETGPQFAVWRPGSPARVPRRQDSARRQLDAKLDLVQRLRTVTCRDAPTPRPAGPAAAQPDDAARRLRIVHALRDLQSSINV